MSYLAMMEARLPPGFRFHPRDDELICDYLTPKVLSPGDGVTNGNSSTGSPTMIDIDLNKCEPWELPGQFTNQIPYACMQLDDSYFHSYKFSPLYFPQLFGALWDSLSSFKCFIGSNMNYCKAKISL